jgi:hypothetical protein
MRKSGRNRKRKRNEKMVTLEGLTQVIEEIRPYRNFTKDMYNGFMMARMSILVELEKYWKDPDNYFRFKAESEE